MRTVTPVPLFPKIRTLIISPNAPIPGITPPRHETSKCEIGPFRGKGHIAVLDRISMDAVDMAKVICLIPNLMLPETSLPERQFPTFPA